MTGPPPTANDANRQLALRFIERTFACDVDAVLDMLAPDATWWVLGDPEKLRVAGTRDRPRIEHFLRRVAVGFPTGLRHTIEGVTAEGERVAIEATSCATRADGASYRNRYHFLVRIRDGRVVEMREYLDTLYAYEAQQTVARQVAPGRG